MNAQSLSHYIPINAQVMTSLYSLTTSTGNDEAAGVDALEAVARNLHTGGPGYMVALPSGLKQGWSSAVV